MEDLKNPSSLGKGEFLIDSFMSLKGKGSQRVTVGDFQYLVYTLRGYGEMNFSIRGDDSPLTLEIRGITLEE